MRYEDDGPSYRLLTHESDWNTLRAVSVKGGEGGGRGGGGGETEQRNGKFGLVGSYLDARKDERPKQLIIR